MNGNNDSEKKRVPPCVDPNRMDSRRLMRHLHSLPAGDLHKALECVEYARQGQLVHAVVAVWEIHCQTPIQRPGRENRSAIQRQKWLKSHLPIEGWNDSMALCIPVTGAKKSTEQRRRAKQPGKEKKKCSRKRMQSFKCGKCNKEMKGKDNLRQHEKNSHGMHDGPQAYPCPFCKRPFKKKSNRDTHVNSHIGVRPYECKLCGECFSQQSNIKRHMKWRHHVKCSVCDKVLVDKADLPAHFKSAHPDQKLKSGSMGIRNFKTDCCNIRFPSYEARNDHEKSCAVILRRRAMLEASRKAPGRSDSEETSSESDTEEPPSDGSPDSTLRKGLNDESVSMSGDTLAIGDGINYCSSDPSNVASSLPTSATLQFPFTSSSSVPMPPAVYSLASSIAPTSSQIFTDLSPTRTSSSVMANTLSSPVMANTLPSPAETPSTNTLTFPPAFDTCTLPSITSAYSTAPTQPVSSTSITLAASSVSVTSASNNVPSVSCSSASSTLPWISNASAPLPCWMTSTLPRSSISVGTSENIVHNLFCSSCAMLVQSVDEIQNSMSDFTCQYTQGNLSSELSSEHEMSSQALSFELVSSPRNLSSITDSSSRCSAEVPKSCSPSLLAANCNAPSSSSLSPREKTAGISRSRSPSLLAVNDNTRGTSSSRRTHKPLSTEGPNLLDEVSSKLQNLKVSVDANEQPDVGAPSPLSSPSTSSPFGFGPLQPVSADSTMTHLASLPIMSDGACPATFSNNSIDDVDIESPMQFVVETFVECQNENSPPRSNRGSPSSPLLGKLASSPGTTMLSSTSLLSTPSILPTDAIVPLSAPRVSPVCDSELKLSSLPDDIYTGNADGAPYRIPLGIRPYAEFPSTDILANSAPVVGHLPSKSASAPTLGGANIEGMPPLAPDFGRLCSNMSVSESDAP